MYSNYDQKHITPSEMKKIQKNIINKTTHYMYVCK